MAYQCHDCLINMDETDIDEYRCTVCYHYICGGCVIECSEDDCNKVLCGFCAEDYTTLNGNVLCKKHFPDEDERCCVIS